jgi:phage FluMu protein Com
MVAHNAAVLHVKCPHCGHARVAVMKTKQGYFIRSHRFGIINKQRCPLSRARVPITLGVRLV